jgi:hypothetical protein
MELVLIRTSGHRSEELRADALSDQMSFVAAQALFTLRLSSSNTELLVVLDFLKTDKLLLVIVAGRSASETRPDHKLRDINVP